MQHDMAQYNLYSRSYFDIVYDTENPEFVAVKERIRDFIKGFGPKEVHVSNKRGRGKQQQEKVLVLVGGSNGEDT